MWQCRLYLQCLQPSVFVFSTKTLTDTPSFIGYSSSTSWLPGRQDSSFSAPGWLEFSTHHSNSHTLHCGIRKYYVLIPVLENHDFYWPSLSWRTSLLPKHDYGLLSASHRLTTAPLRITFINFRKPKISWYVSSLIPTTPIPTHFFSSFTGFLLNTGSTLKNLVNSLYFQYFTLLTACTFTFPPVLSHFCSFQYQSPHHIVHTHNIKRS